MSEKLIKALNSTTAMGQFFIILACALFIGAAVYCIIQAIAYYKRQRIEKEIKAKEDVFDDRIAELSQKQADGEIPFSEYSAKRDEIRKEKDADPDLIALRTKVKKSREWSDDKVDGFFKIAGGMCGIYMIMALVLMFVYSTGYGGTIGDIHAVECKENTVCVPAYYNVRYKEVNQSTLTVFVKNNSGKDVKSATIIEKNSKAQSTVKNLDNGEEKIVSIVVYNKDGAEFEFEIVDVEYVE